MFEQFNLKTKDKKDINKNVKDNRKRLLSKESAFDVKEAYKELRTNVMFSLTDPGCKKIAVTSSIASEGKSTTCFNLALTFAETGAKVVVVDCDLRRPNVSRLVARPKEKGLSNYLIKDVALDKIIFDTDYENLSVVLAGNIPPNPTELLASSAMTDLVKELEDRFDYIFLDTPPVTIVTDAAVISKLVQGVILIVRQNISEKPVVTDALSKLEFVNAKILGFVLNDVQFNNAGYGGYKYKYYKRGYYKRGYYA